MGDDDDSLGDTDDDGDDVPAFIFYFFVSHFPPHLANRPCPLLSLLSDGDDHDVHSFNKKEIVWIHLLLLFDENVDWFVRMGPTTMMTMMEETFPQKAAASVNPFVILFGAKNIRKCRTESAAG